MADVTPLLAALALVALATAVGVLLRMRDGRVRRGSGERVLAKDLGVPAESFGPVGTLLQFSTEHCSRCPAARRLLSGIADDRAGVRHLEVDLTRRTDLAGRYAVLATPTTLVLDGGGRIRARLTGAPRRDAVLAALRPLHPEGSR